MLAAVEKTEGGGVGRVIAVFGEKGWGVEDLDKGPFATIESRDVSLLVGDGGWTEMRLAQMKRCAPLVVLSGELCIVSIVDTDIAAELCLDCGISPFSTSGGV